MYMATSSIFEEDDMVFNKSGGKIQSAGFTVDSILMQKGEAPLITRNMSAQTGGSVANLFKDLAVPAGLVYFSKKQYGGDALQSTVQNDDTFVSDDLHEKLLKMVEVEGGSKKLRKTRRSNEMTMNHSKTKKQRNKI
jgi:hypothetical protein